MSRKKDWVSREREGPGVEREREGPGVERRDVLGVERNRLGERFILEMTLCNVDCMSSVDI